MSTEDERIYMSDLEIDIRGSFPDEYTPDNWTDLVPRFVELEAAQTIADYRSHQEVLDQYFAKVDYERPFVMPGVNYRLMRATSWLVSYKLFNLPLLAYENALLQHQVNVVSALQATVDSQTKELAQLRNDMAEVKRNSTDNPTRQQQK